MLGPNDLSKSHTSRSSDWGGSLITTILVSSSTLCLLLRDFGWRRVVPRRSVQSAWWHLRLLRRMMARCGPRASPGWKAIPGTSRICVSLSAAIAAPKTTLDRSSASSWWAMTAPKTAGNSSRLRLSEGRASGGNEISRSLGLVSDNKKCAPLNEKYEVHESHKYPSFSALVRRHTFKGRPLRSATI